MGKKYIDSYDNHVFMRIQFILEFMCTDKNNDKKETNLPPLSFHSNCSFLRVSECPFKQNEKVLKNMTVL